VSIEWGVFDVPPGVTAVSVAVLSGDGGPPAVVVIFELKDRELPVEMSMSADSADEIAGLLQMAAKTARLGDLPSMN
jgi:hypothetical protein